MQTKHRPRALLCTAGFGVVAGSEMVLLELAEQLIARGWAVDITAWFVDEPMRTITRKAGARILSGPSQAMAFTYDLIWLQNRIETVLCYDKPSESCAPRTLFVFAHLDRTWGLAQPGVVGEGILGQMFVATCEENVALFTERGLPEGGVTLFRNPAPASFERPARPGMDRPRKILLVSNHIPDEVRHAAVRLAERGVGYWHWGEGGNTYARFTADALNDVDAVVTIGKTVPYALLSRRPVYLYDHFGGPGWLSEDNFACAARHNFSGRCNPTVKTGDRIADEILDGFAAAARWSGKIDDTVLQDFRLSRFVDRMIAAIDDARTWQQHRDRLDSVAVPFGAEKAIMEIAGYYFFEAMDRRRIEREERAAIAPPS